MLIDQVDQPNLKVHPPRRVPYPIRNKVKEEMVKSNIIAPITEPTPAVSAMVVVWLNSRVRICIDPSDLNRIVERHRFRLHSPDTQQNSNSLTSL
ncbi:hypothetical protein PR048_020952 [Dryococelus australis]|uniref:Uncharacterized protein n=1 Tax=Dryococelus australis TaxID=614101 RepID=A0ABQ9GWV5_9NEOP|nr:hypothetical protein PR048_020952 [Dryococelus australis]